jgi:hypothetical protein
MGCAQSLLKLDADLETLYSLDKCIGEGVEGLVYLATCKASGAKVAIKLVPRWVQQHSKAARHENLLPCVLYGLGLLLQSPGSSSRNNSSSWSAPAAAAAAMGNT